MTNEMIREILRRHYQNALNEIAAATLAQIEPLARRGFLVDVFVPTGGQTHPAPIFGASDAFQAPLPVARPVDELPEAPYGTPAPGAVPFTQALAGAESGPAPATNSGEPAPVRAPSVRAPLPPSVPKRGTKVARVLAAIRRNPGIHHGQIARHTGLGKQVGAVLQALKRRGLAAPNGDGGWRVIEIPSLDHRSEV